MGLGWFKKPLTCYIPSGKLTVCYWKWPSRNSGFTQLWNGGSFHSYVSLPEGTFGINLIIFPVELYMFQCSSSSIGKPWPSPNKLYQLHIACYVYIRLYYALWQCVKTLYPCSSHRIAGKWMFIPLKMVLIGIDPYPYWDMSLYHHSPSFQRRHDVKSRRDSTKPMHEFVVIYYPLVI